MCMGLFNLSYQAVVAMPRAIHEIHMKVAMTDARKRDGVIQLGPPLRLKNVIVQSSMQGGGRNYLTVHNREVLARRRRQR